MKMFNSKNTFYLSLAIMLIPVLFFVSIIMDQLFSYDSILEKFFLPVQEASGLYSTLLIVSLPATALLLILVRSDAFNKKINDNLIIDNIKIPFTVKNILLSLSCFLIFSTVTIFVIFENTL